MKKITLNGPITMNCYIIDYKNKCFIVDPGYNHQSIHTYVKDNNLEVIGILLTHGHPDHIGGIDCYDVPIYMHKIEEEFIRRRLSSEHKSPRFSITYDFDKLNHVMVDEGSLIPFEDKTIAVLHTPGHTAGEICFIFEEDIFSGDTLFKSAVGRWDFPSGSLEDLRKSVTRLIDTQPLHYGVHPGHGESSTIGQERKQNPYYLQWKTEE